VSTGEDRPFFNPEDRFNSLGIERGWVDTLGTLVEISRCADALLNENVSVSHGSSGFCLEQLESTDNYNYNGIKYKFPNPKPYPIRPSSSPAIGNLTLQLSSYPCFVSTAKT
jgi:hypothetical protein